MQERRNSIGNALELRLSCTNPWNVKNLFENDFQKMLGILSRLQLVKS